VLREPKQTWCSIAFRISHIGPTQTSKKRRPIDEYLGRCQREIEEPEQKVNKESGQTRTPDWRVSWSRSRIWCISGCEIRERTGSGCKSGMKVYLWKERIW
jgi:hypothetical protein